MPRVTVFVIGSFRDGCKGTEQQFREAGKLLGQALADHSCDLVLNSDKPKTIDPWIFDGYCRGRDPGKVTVFRPEARYAANEARQPFAGCADKRVSLAHPRPSGTFRTSHLRSIAASDVVLAIGGSARGTLNAVSAAEVLLKPVAGLLAFGGATEDAATDYQHYYSDSVRRQLISDLTGLTSAWADQFVRGLLELASSNPVARSRASLHPIQASLVFLASAVAWLVAYTNAGDLLVRYSLPATGGMLLSACAFGVVLQRVAMAAGLPVPTRSSRSAVLEWIVAVGVSTILIFIALMAGNLLANKAIEPITIADLQRTGLTVTAIAATSTLATEAAWKKIVDWATSSKA